MTDIETERLREAVVEAAMVVANYRGGDKGPMDRLENAVDNLAHHLAKSAPEPAPLKDRLNYARSHGCDCGATEVFLKHHKPLCPARLAGEALLEMSSPIHPVNREIQERMDEHYFPMEEAEIADLLPCPFCGGACDPEGWASSTDGGETLRHGPACDDCGGSADTLEIWNTRHSPAIPDTRVMPTDEAIADWLRSTRPASYPVLIRAALARFSPTQPAPVQQTAYSECFVCGTSWTGGIHACPTCQDEAASQPAGVQQTITDEEIVAELRAACNSNRDIAGSRAYVVFQDDAITMVRTLLAKHSPTLSDSLLLQLRDIAISNDDPGEYLTDAKIRLAGVGK